MTSVPPTFCIPPTSTVSATSNTARPGRTGQVGRSPPSLGQVRRSTPSPISGPGGGSPCAGRSFPRVQQWSRRTTGVSMVSTTPAQRPNRGACSADRCRPISPSTTQASRRTRRPRASERPASPPCSATRQESLALVTLIVTGPCPRRPGIWKFRRNEGLRVERARGHPTLFSLGTEGPNRSHGACRDTGRSHHATGDSCTLGLFVSARRCDRRRGRRAGPSESPVARRGWRSRARTQYSSGARARDPVPRRRFGGRGFQLARRRV